MHVKIYTGNTLFTSIKAKRIDVSIDGHFVKITDFNNNVIETSTQNVIIIHEQEKGDSKQ